MTSTQNATFETLAVTVDGPVVRIEINRPKQLNALSVKVLEEIDSAIDAAVNRSTRVVVLEGSGDKAFVAGADIAAMSDLSPIQAREFALRGQRLTRRLELLPQIVVAKVQGFALGGGCELAMACDIIVAGKEAKFGQPEVNLGLIPGFGGTQRLTRRVGLPVAIDVLCCGKARTLSGEEAHSLGLVSRVVDNDKLDDEVNLVIKGILKAAPEAVADTKRLARESYRMDIEAGLSAEANTFVACFARDEAKEGISAFLEKRSPKFS